MGLNNSRAEIGDWGRKVKDVGFDTAKVAGRSFAYLKNAVVIVLCNTENVVLQAADGDV